MAKSEYVFKQQLNNVFSALTVQNRLVCDIALQTGLRISDVLSLTPQQFEKNRFTVKEQKTGKTKQIYIRENLRKLSIAQTGEFYLFPNRFDEKRHKTRQAIYADIRRACKAFRLKQQGSPHSLRKIYAVDLYAKYGDMKKVQKALNHSNQAVTIIYALADMLTERKKKVTK